MSYGTPKSNFPDMYGQRRVVRVESRSVSVTVSLPPATEAKLLAITRRQIAQGHGLLPESTVIGPWADQERLEGPEDDPEKR